MPHTRKKRKAQAQKQHPKHYTVEYDKIKPSNLVDCLVLVIKNDKSLTLEQFEQVYKEVVRRCNED